MYHLCYPARPNESIFDAFSVSIPKGTTTTLVGRSGSTKSTVIGLIVSFYAGAQLVESGKVTFAEAFRIFYGVSLTATVISQSGGLVPDSTEAKTGASSIVALFDRQSKIDSSNNSGMTLVLIQKVVQLYKRKCEGPVRAGIKEGLLSSARFGFSMFCWYYAYAVSFYAGARLIESGEVTFAEVLQVFYGLVFTVNTLYRSIDLVPDSTKAKTGASSIFALLDRKSKIDSSDNSRMTLDNLKENIEFQLSKIYVYAALVGESGRGKSTAISLLQRFYDLDSSLITLDGIEIQKLNVKWL
ncbi:hypothetical protein FXO38_26509 [Capsicum annuum]|nr:hypothetical protein FXO38_26509 [Capsicum annuum]